MGTRQIKQIEDIAFEDYEQIFKRLQNIFEIRKQACKLSLVRVQSEEDLKILQEFIGYCNSIIKDNLRLN